MNDCIFCRIIEGTIPAYKIYEDDKFLAFLDVFPFVEGHSLVVPKQHLRWVWDYPNLNDYFTVTAKIAKHFRKVTKEEMVRLVIFGADVPHAHIHLKPYRKDNWKGVQLSREKMERIRQKFRVPEFSNK